ncbi:MAG: site-specific integrase [Actinomycetota bacterium]|nr:site-specific integrase [Actinomycetota bacterium]
MRVDVTMGQWIDPRSRRVTFKDYAERWRSVQIRPGQVPGGGAVRGRARPSAGELFGLATDRLEFLERVVRVDQQLVRVRTKGVMLGPLKTSASYRSIPLPEVVGQEIAAHLQEWPSHAELGLIFTNERGGASQQYPFGVMFEKARAKAGLPEWATPHDLRHFYASTLIGSGASIKVVQTRLGHASAKVTLDVYGHLFRDEDDRTRQAIESALSPINSEPAIGHDLGE